MKLKSILAVISAFTIVFGSVPTQPFADVIGNLSITVNAEDDVITGSCGAYNEKTGKNDDVNYSLDKVTCTLTISGSGAMSNYTSSRSPFYKNTVIKKVIIENDVKSIGNNVFSGCINITSISIPDGVISIGDYAFYNCTSLTSITIPDSVTSIGDGAFYNCTSLTSISIPDSVQSISRYAFQGCTSLTSVEIPNSVTSIGNYAFSMCTSLTSITIPNFVTSIGNNAFNGCGKLTNITAPCKLYTSASSWKNGCSATVTYTNHTKVIDEAKEATCTETGLKEGSKCSVCGQTLVAQEEIPAKGHTEVIDVEEKKATCTDAGYTKTSHCSVCNEQISKQEVIPALGHTEVIDEAVAPTCTETGLKEGSKCSVCGQTLVAQEEIPAKGHTEVIEIEEKEATCTETGIKAKSHCSVCNEIISEQEVIPAKGHTVVTDEAVAPTCTETGLTEGSKCSVCGQTLVAQEEIPAKGHTEVIDIEEKEATCTETGIKAKSHCSVCNEQISKQEVIPALGHTEVIDEAVAPTCTETGLKEGSKCSVCGQTFVAQETVEALGHTFENGKCSACGATIEFKGLNLVLSGQIGVNFFVKVPDGFDMENSFMNFKINGREESICIKDGEKRTINNIEMYKFTCYVTSIEMADKIYAYVTKGEETIIENNFSVKDYIDSASTSTKDEKTIALINSIADYGSYIQPYLASAHNITNYNAMKSAHTITEEDITNAKSALTSYKYELGVNNSDVERIGFQLNLKDKTTLYIALLMPENYGGFISAKLSDNTKLAVEKVSDTTYRVVIADISAHELGDAYTVTITTDKGDYTVTASALTFAYNAINSANTNECTKKAMTAFYRYYSATMEYRNKNN